MKVLIDTNVILDFFLIREPQLAEADKIFELIYKEEIRAFTTASCITDIYYIVCKKCGEDLARDAVRQLLKMFGVIAVDGSDCLSALDLPIADFEDALVVTCAKKETVDYIVSGDRGFMQIDAQFAKLVDSKEFLNIIDKH